MPPLLPAPQASSVRQRCGIMTRLLRTDLIQLSAGCCTASQFDFPRTSEGGLITARSIDVHVVSTDE